MALETLIIVVARNEGERLDATLSALAQAFPGAALLLADDGSTDASAQIAQRRGATVIASGAPLGKGGAATLAARAALARPDVAADTVVLLCDGDLGDCAAELSALTAAVADGQADLAVARFARRIGGGFGLAVRFARLAIHRRCGLRTSAPISGQRALRAALLAELLPFADGYGMEIGMTIDAVRGGHRVAELELELSHRATGRTLGGFIHRGRQLVDFLRAYRARR